jgi:hypothetical protein
MVTVVTLVSGFHRPAVLGELNSLSILPSYYDSALIILFIIIVMIYASGLFQLQVLYLLVELSLTSLFISCNF